MSATPAADALPRVPESDEPSSLSQSWMYRSEAFAEDLDDAVSASSAGPKGRAQQAWLRLTLPLSALVLGVGMALLYGLH